MKISAKDIPENILNRRTFAIISHPDAGKTTLTEQILLESGAINLAGQVRAKASSKRTVSDFIKIEKERGISVSTSAMSIDYGGYWLNLVDTPGHADFSEDTYRTLTAVDFVIMVIDGAKGVESQTKKLFEICRLRDLPIITFCNKMDRESREVVDIIDEIQETLALEVSPINYPIGKGNDFIGCYELNNGNIELLIKQNKNIKNQIKFINSKSNNQLSSIINKEKWEQEFENLNLIKSLTAEFNYSNFQDGVLSPIFFGSAIYSLGIKRLLKSVIDYGPYPKPRQSKKRLVKPDEKYVSGFIFKVQANMDFRHRDRVAFLRICSGKFKRGMKLYHVRSKKFVTISNPILFLAKDRNIVDEAWAGDIIGIPNHGQFMIGDTFTESENIKFLGIPSFAPEIMKKITTTDPLKSKHLNKSLIQFAEEGLIKLFKTNVGDTKIIGVIGILQFDVLKHRMETEYNIPVKFEEIQYNAARWLIGDNNNIEKFVEANSNQIAKDHENDYVYLIRINWDLEKSIRDFPSIKFNKVKEINNS